jgi:hypothetical protein
MDESEVGLQGPLTGKWRSIVRDDIKACVVPYRKVATEVFRSGRAASRSCLVARGLGTMMGLLATGCRIPSVDAAGVHAAGIHVANEAAGIKHNLAKRQSYPLRHTTRPDH